MNDYILISNINDFIFCPISIYFHNLYGDMDKLVYTSSIQVKGTNAHKSIDNNSYSTKSSILQSIDIYSEKLKICGKIDLFDIINKELIERKRNIKTIYDGYIFQLYAQYFCLIEMGYDIKKLSLYDYEKNIKYDIDLPKNNKSLLRKFIKIIESMNNFDMSVYRQENQSKCIKCIYNNICDRCLYVE